MSFLKELSYLFNFSDELFYYFLNKFTLRFWLELHKPINEKIPHFFKYKDIYSYI